MKKTIITVAIIITTIIAMAFTRQGECIVISKNASGARFGHSGDPAGSGKNCTACHDDGPAPEMKTGWITSNIPETGYIPKTTYTIQAKVTAAGHTKFGFQITPQNSAGTFLGTFSNTNSDTRLTSNTNYLTSSSAGTSGTDEKIWTFNWTAPAAGSGPVTFYGAFNITNSDSGTTGDTIKLSTTTVTENQQTGVNDIANSKQNIAIHPNPAIDIFTIESNNSMIGSTYRVLDQTGKLVLTGKIDDEKTTVNISHFNAGVYFVQIGEQNTQTFKVVKK